MSTPDSRPERGFQDRRAQPCALVIFGITGDLAGRKLLPALYALSRDGLLPEGLAVVGFGRRDWSHEQFRRQVGETLAKYAEAPDPEAFARFADRLFFAPGQMDDLDGVRSLGRTLSEVDRTAGTRGNRLFYLATPPEFYSPVARLLGEADLAGPRKTSSGWTRLVVEKPFGRDLESARRLQADLRTVFTEEEIFRIDHYLGKETVQNVLVFRFGNSIFEPLWNRNHVLRVQVTAAETLGVEARGQYYEGSGALRDMVQSHLLQLLCLTAMEPPAAFTADSVAEEKLKVLQSIRRPRPGTVADTAVRGRYAAGRIKGEAVPGYGQEKGVAPDSRTETFAAVRLLCDNWRWQGVPFHLRTGKRLHRKTTEIIVTFRPPPLRMFAPCRLDEVTPNRLIWRIQPDEGISLSLEAKPPGPDVCVGSIPLEFSYAKTFGAHIREAYETLLLDAMAGDKMLYAGFDWVEESWKLMTPILAEWDASAAPIPEYPAGTWGPAEADRLCALDGLRWEC